MAARARILAIKLMEKQEKNPEYAKQIGIQVRMVRRDRSAMEGSHA